jgi:single-strand DNA-binding protein
MALVEGKLNIRSYEDKEGQKKYVTEVIADVVKFVGGKDEGHAPAHAAEEAVADSGAVLDKEFETAMEKDNLPF